MKNNILVVIAGLVLMTGFYGCGNNPRFKNYSGSNPALGVSLDYVSDWKYREHSGKNNSYSGVVFYENKKTDTFKPLIGLTVRSVSASGSQSPQIESVADDLISKRMKFKDASVLARSNTNIANAPAISIELSYKIFNRLRALNAELVQSKEKVVLFIKGGKLYILRYQNTEQDFARYAPAFDRIAASLKTR